MNVERVRPKSFGIIRNFLKKVIKINRNKSIFLIASILLVFSNCAHLWYSVQTTHDEFDGYTINRMSRNDINGGKGFLEISLICLNAQRFQSKEGQIIYSLIVYYEDSEWLFIEDGESLILLIDGSRLGLTGDGSWKHRTVLSGGAVREQAWYDISLDDLKRIANAKEVKMKVSGSQFYKERSFTDVNFKNFKDFISKYCVENSK